MKIKKYFAILMTAVFVSQSIVIGFGSTIVYASATDKIKGTAENVGKSVTGAANDVTEATKNVSDAVGKSAKETAVKTTKSAQEVVGKASQTAKDVSKTAKETAEKAGETAKETTNKATKTAQEVAEKASQTAKDASKAAKETAEKAGETAKKTTDKAAKTAQETAGKASQTAKDVSTAAKGKASEVGKTTVESAEGALKTAGYTATSVGNNIKRYVASIDTEKYKSGWDYASKYTGVAIASLKGKAYVETVQSITSQMQKELNEKVVSGRSVAQDAGFAAEIWHTNTFNLESVLNGSEYKATRPDSNAKASVDVSIEGKGYTQDYSLKYYKDAESSAKAQAKTFFEDYREYSSKAQRHGEKVMSEEEYLTQYGKSLDALYESLYSGQKRLIPADQLEDARKYLMKSQARMGASESVERQKFAPELQKSLDDLASRIEAPDGTKSKPLSEQDARLLVELTRDEKDMTLQTFHLTPADLITTRYILKQSVNAGAQSAAVSMAFAIGPDVYRILVDAAKDGKIDESKLKETGIEGVLAGSEGFVEGSVSSAIVIACQSGKFGAAYTNIAPETVGTLTVLVIDAMRFGYQLSKGQITEEEYAELMTEDIFIAMASQTSGALLQALFPFIPFAYIAGSMAGAMLASVGYQAGKELYLEVRGENGFETVVPITLKRGVSIASNYTSSFNIGENIAKIKHSAVTMLNDGKLKITSIVNK